MKTLLHKIINDEKRSGLYLVNTPTGSAKSYTSVQVIKEHLDDFRVKRFIFITNDIKNLPMNDFKVLLGDDQVIQLKNNIDNIMENLDSFIASHDKKYEFSTFDSYQVLKKTMSDYELCLENGMDMRYVREKMDMAERNFRFAVANYIKDILRENGVTNRKDYVKKYYYELQELYPAMFFDDYRVVCLTTSKFFMPLDIIYDKAVHLMISPLLEDAVVFIDEFDATKEVINNILIENACRQPIDYPTLSHAVSNSFKEENFSRYKQTTILQAAKNLENRTKEIIAYSTDISKSLYLPYSMDCEQGSDRNFILSDLSYLECFVDKNIKKCLLYFDEQHNKVMIKFVKRDEEFSADFVMYIPYYLRKIHRYLLTIDTYLLNLASALTNMELLKDKKLDKAETEHKYYESLLHDLRYDESIISYFRNLHWQFFQKGRMLRRLNKFTNNYYYRGIRLYEIKKDLTNNVFNASLDYYSIPTTPEYLLMQIVSKAKVIGLSATANFRNVYGNYNLDFLSEELGDDFHLMDADDFQRIKHDYEVLNQKYETGEITVHIDEVSSQFEFKNNIIKEIEGMIAIVFNDPGHREQVKNIFKSHHLLNSDYCLNRYLSVCYVYKQFLEHDYLKSFLCLNNKLPSMKDDDFNFSMLKDLFTLLDKEHGKEDIKVVLLKSGSDFEENKKALLDDLRVGKKVFVLSAYGTIGAGQNLAYEVDNFEGLVNLVGNRDESDARHRRKDFDGIYLGEVTNVLTTTSLNGSLTLKDQLKYIIDLENLYENNEIYAYVKNRHIKACLNNKLFRPDASIKNSKSARMFKTTKYTQAVGRLSRSFNKNPHIHIYIHHSVIRDFDCSILETEILSPETKKLALYIYEQKGKVEVNENYKMLAERKSNLARANFYEILSHEWTSETVKEYESIGEFVLKHPTISKDALEEFKVFYMSCGKVFNRYYFQNEKDFENTEIYFTETKKEAFDVLESLITTNKAPKYLRESNFYEASEINARLLEILNYPGMKAHFEAKGYATSFEENDYMITPYMYQAIYKGRLGEVAARFILENVFKIKLESLDLEEYELFDMKYKDIYIDIKHWRYSNVSHNKMMDKVKAKMASTKAKYAIFINLFDESEQSKISVEEGVIQIPALLENDGSKIRKDALLILNKYLGEE